MVKRASRSAPPPFALAPSPFAPAPTSTYQALLEGFRNGTIPQDLDVDAKLDDLGGTPLHVAAMAGNVTVLDEIASRALDINVRNRMGSTALAVAAAHDDRASVDCLVKHGALVNTRDQNGSSPLHDAIFYRRIDMAQQLIAAGADVNEVFRHNHSPLYAVSKSDSDDLANALIPALIAAGANIQDAMKSGFCQVGWSDIKLDRVRLFLAHGARFADMPPLHNESMVTNIPYLQLYLEQGGNPNKQDETSIMPLLYYALAKQSREAVELLAPVADINFIDYATSIPHFRASLKYSTKACVDMAPLSQAINKNLDTALLQQMLHHASVQPPEYYVEAFKMALEAKSASNVALLASKVDLKSECFLHYAVRNPDFVAVLLELGADPNQRDQYGRPPLLGACELREETSARILLPHTANCDIPGYLELEYMAALCTLLDEPFWWKKEALPTLPPGAFMDDTAVIHGELQLIRDTVVRPLGLVPNTTRGVYHADDALSVDLLSSLGHHLAPLEAAASWADNVLEVVDPAMYGAVYGQSRFSVHPHNMQEGISSSAIIRHKTPSSMALADAVCPHLQMLPTPVTWDPSSRQVTLESYVNNIHPSQSALYTVLAKTLSTVLPLLDAARWVPRKDIRRIERGGGHENELRLLRDAYLQHHGLDPSAPVLQKTLRAFKKAQGPITSQLQPAPPTLECAQRFWKGYAPHFDDDGRNWQLPSKPQSHQVLCHVQCLRVTPEAPTMTTVWRRGSGAVNEAIDFTAVILHGADNVSLRIEFRETYKYVDFGPHKRNPAIEVLLSDKVPGRVSQDTGFVTLRPGRLLLIRSSAAYRLHLHSADSSREGVAKLLFWGFVRPSGTTAKAISCFAREGEMIDNAILSTADVPPQQRAWLLDLVNATPLGRVPTVVQELVIDFVGHATLSTDEARAAAIVAKAAREVIVAASLA
ncbi:hypothetical protein SPRG_21772 [Saprolegnia parasitica CBS 223.65]|uniref:DUF4246 domain-containing protein n=1 Tax=Saprolegnia parasitica (strain CBS 223.65) TaxID=695850 RepID=A0A067BI20_SAPPC|nr:hypothetical protein SPRG_21772 [Saprolegnia parasitica CBS 223.65]KDO18044.1 hypothetical protein SPRG_21772 [Saprolegnia parasitica CBS 223.65]|eukprot:XP_012211248.1 hypothetical protein SPRG_21772 [Saprolegnia parasitica CBS 223.65]